MHVRSVPRGRRARDPPAAPPERATIGRSAGPAASRDGREGLRAKALGPRRVAEGFGFGSAARDRRESRWGASATILEGWQKDGIGFVRFELPDMHGISRSKTIPIAHAADYAERGLNMYGGVSVLDSRSDVVAGTLYHEEVGYGDQLLFPDPDSAAVVPWADRTARLICDAQWYDGTPLAATPRHVFRSALEKARGMGFEPLMGSEFEFYLLTGDTHEPLFDGYHIFNTVRNDYVPTIRRILEEMPAVGVDIITSNCEYAGSQWEINFAPGRGLAGPDHAFTFKNGVKEIAKQDGYLATFMSKPYADSAGSGCHTHLSLLDADTGDNAFADEADPDGMSDTAARSSPACSRTRRPSTR